MGKDVILACDFSNKEQMTEFFKTFNPQNTKPYLKIGMELFYAEGPDIVKWLKDKGYPIFLDLKLHDIPTTVYKAMKNLAQLRVDMVNVHAAGGHDMMRLAVEGLNEGSNNKVPLLIAVTMLTSTSPTMMHEELLIAEEMQKTVVHYARNAKTSGLDGVVCSAKETSMIKQHCGNNFITVTPGIRYADGEKGDQVRVMTPQQANSVGSDYIVVGRTITNAKNPTEMYKKVYNDFTK